VRVTYRKLSVGLNRTPSWIVSFSGSAIAILHEYPDGDVIVAYGFEPPWDRIWAMEFDSLTSAKEHFAHFAGRYSRGASPEQIAEEVQAGNYAEWDSRG